MRTRSAIYSCSMERWRAVVTAEKVFNRCIEMKHVAFLSAVILSIAFFGAGFAGCGNGSTSNASEDTANRIEKPGPEESFELIVETFRRGIEDIPIGFVMRQESGQSMMVGKNEVSHQLIRPTMEGEPYRAIITVSSESRYSIQRNREETEPEDEQEDQSVAGNLFDDAQEDGQEIFDSELIGGASSKNETRRTMPGETEQFVARRPDKDERHYELVYENGRWNLITETDEETEKSIGDAFDRALKTQIEG